MNTVEINGQKYQLSKLSALAQFHVSRRLAPILTTMGVSLQMLKSGIKLDLDDFVAILGPVTDLMAKMSDDDVNYIIFTCLGVVKREQTEGKYAAVLTSGNLIMFADIDMPVMIRLVIEVFKDNLGPFLMGLGGDPTSPSS